MKSKKSKTASVSLRLSDDLQQHLLHLAVSRDWSMSKTIHHHLRVAIAALGGKTDKVTELKNELNVAHQLACARIEFVSNINAIRRKSLKKPTKRTTTPPAKPTTT